MKLDILAIAAHPDDAELSCSGTLLQHKQKGYKTGIIDLTQGELGSRGSIALRKQESDAATEIMQLDIRENLHFRDGFFQNDEKHQLALIQMIRKYQPDIVLANAPNDRHPDHGKAASLAKDACYYAGLVKIETMLDGQVQQAWRPKKIFNYIQDQYLEPDFIIDISDVIDQKMDCILAFKSQFLDDESNGPATYISSETYTNRVMYRNNLMGKKIGVAYGEGFLSVHSHIGFKTFESFILPEFA
ncbi:MAG: bacillithiol biosynthesis deacetylase BshB1 [Bacteroidetes bacterium]|jgi:bacillithiol biosynthesis deacetylase BshB1|nr:bacillithiol biosynthesis deacetylase BshB1 [Bacteroidota bacterium]MBK6820892.1 bacillithiol biosynthesis deacetylase BshB1 [Bacteroidota bacterium]MBK7039083.1 bacillithiol biosynthesis deacetylase BshB1 [Bacteroidota bacterium]MBK7587680.1 bacillithiol biosynthesis deacetylase BshB1 [Bacteroidota bacterium]MBK8329277.1 bacillithiol biosynthesis deacetylase BshB1 [Bacteroidota bacterium]